MHIYIYIQLLITATLAAHLCHASTDDNIKHSQWIVLDTNGQILDVDPTPYILKQHEHKQMRRPRVKKMIIPKHIPIKRVEISSHSIELNNDIIEKKVESQSILPVQPSSRQEQIKEDEEDEFESVFFRNVQPTQPPKRVTFRFKEFQIVRFLSDLFGWQGIEGSILFAEVVGTSISFSL